jgi:3-dehydrosphinganine reductase
MGRGVAKILAQKGADVVIVARNQNRLAEALAYVSVSCNRTIWRSIKRSRVTDPDHRLQRRTPLSNVSPPSPQM